MPPVPEGKGTGVGLTIAKGIMELSRGEINLESSLNQGTKVSLKFPVYTFQKVFDECIVDLLKEADEKNSSVTVVLCEIRGFNMFLEKTGREKAAGLIKRLEGVVKRTFGRGSDKILGVEDKILAILSGSTSRVERHLFKLALLLIASRVSTISPFTKVNGR